MRSRVAAFAGFAAIFASVAPADEAKPLSVGTRVRIHAGEAIEIPGVMALGPHSVETKGVVVHDDGKLVAVKMPAWSEPVCLPRPKANLTGRLVGIDAEALTLTVDGQDAPFRVPRSAIGRLDVSTGHRSKGGAIAKGAGLGLLIGGTVGALVGVASRGSCSGGCLFNTSEDAFIGGILGGGVGLVMGAAIGAATSTDRWKEVPASQLQVRVHPVRRGVGASVALAF